MFANARQDAGIFDWPVNCEGRRYLWLRGQWLWIQRDKINRRSRSRFPKSQVRIQFENGVDFVEQDGIQSPGAKSPPPPRPPTTTPAESDLEIAVNVGDGGRAG